MSERETYSATVRYYVKGIARSHMAHTVAGSKEQAVVQIEAAYSGFHGFEIEAIGTREEWRRACEGGG